MKNVANRREFLRAGAVAGAAIALPRSIFPESRKSVLVFTKSSGFEHDVVKTDSGKSSIVENAVRQIGNKYGFDVIATKDGRVFDSGEFRKYAAMFFFTTGDLTTPGTDKNPPMSPQGKEAFLAAIRGGMGFVGTHAAADTFHFEPDNDDSRYVAHGERCDPYIRMIGAEFITHGSTP